MTTITSANAAAAAATVNNASSTPSSASGAAANSLGMTATDFLQLLTTQLKNQDPLNPTDPSQFTDQLAQINMVEQETQTNQTLSQMLAAQNTSTMSMGVSYIGKQVLAPGNSFADTGQPVNLAYKMPAGAASGTISITDSQGNVVYTATPSFTQGVTNFTWNGQTNSGASAPSGTYNLQVSALNASGQALNVTSYTPGLVSGLETGSDGSLQLVVGNTTVPISSVIGVSLPPS